MRRPTSGEKLPHDLFLHFQKVAHCFLIGCVGLQGRIKEPVHAALWASAVRVLGLSHS